jgi:hypothetical protein
MDTSVDDSAVLAGSTAKGEVEDLDANRERALPATKQRAKERKPNTKILARLLCCCNMDT